MTASTQESGSTDQRAQVPALAHLFEALTESELRRLMFVIHSRAGLELPGPAGSHAGLALHAAEMVTNHGALDIEFLQALLELRPRRRLEIERIAQAVGLTLPARPQGTKSQQAAPARTHIDAEVQNPSATTSTTGTQRYGFAALIYAALSSALFVAILVGSPEQLPSYKLAMVAVSVALMAGFLSMFLTGHVLVRLSGGSRPWHPILEAGGGIAIVVFVLVWWPKGALEPSQSSPVSEAPQPSPENSAGKADVKAGRPPPKAEVPPVNAELEPSTPRGTAERKTGPASPKTRADVTVPPIPSRSKWTIARVVGKTMTLNGPDLPPTGLLRLIQPVSNSRVFASAVDCRIEAVPMTCMLVVKPGNSKLEVGDILELPQANP